MITVSVVSHGQNAMVNQLVQDLARHCAPADLLLTENIADSIALSGTGQVLRNAAPKGFGANHNAAFAHCRTPFFCVLNPDVRLRDDPFPMLVSALADAHAGVVGPLVRNAAAQVEDSARRFPTPGRLLRKAFETRTAAEYPCDRGPLKVDWVAGMCMLFRAEAYRAVGGFDEGYFLYYEDVDICRRLQAAGWSAIYEPRAEIVHLAQRASRRNLRLALHHLSSVLRFMTTR